MLRKPVPIAILLLAALGLSALLAIAALTTERYQRAQAERVLRDYAAFAAQSYSVRAAQQLFYVIGPALDSVGRDRRRAALPAPLLDTIRAHAAAYGPQWSFAVRSVMHAGREQILVYRLHKDSAGAVRDAFGFLADPGLFATPLRNAFTSAPLLPRALARGLERHEMGTLRVRFGGRELYASGPWDDSLFTATQRIGDYFGPTEVEVALRSSAAGALIIGGLPRSRLPFIAGLFALTAALVAWALVQLMRERRLARLRSDFVSGVSHELRTPLAQVRMFAETLLLDRVRNDEERRRSLTIIDQEARRLSHLVDNVLHFTRTERVALRLEPRRIPLAPLLRDVVEGYQPLADNRRATLVLDAPRDVEAPADESALRQVLLNLLDNAVKYGPDGQTVTVSLSALNGDARIAVADEGPGIPPKDRSRIWERFVRLDRDQGTAVAGTGIGLAVVRELVSLHGGRCGVEHTERGGARFVVTLPLANGSA